MDFLLNVMSWVGDFVAHVIEQATGWQPDARAKSMLDWVGSITGAFLGVWGVLALWRGNGQATKADIETLRAQIREEFHKALAQREATGPAGAQPSAPSDSGIGRDLDRAIDTLIAAGKTEALRDTSGTAAEAALDKLIAEKSAARSLVRRTREP